MFPVVQDKYAVKEYASRRGVSCAPLLHVTEDPLTIPFDDLPADCMIKATHGCGWNIIRSGGMYYDLGQEPASTHDLSLPLGPMYAGRPALSVEQVVARCRQWLGARHIRLEWAYGQIRPRIIVEALLQPRVGDELLDLRCYTFRGQVRAINIGSPSYRRQHLNVFLRPDWSLIPLTRSNEVLPRDIPVRPDRLPDMLRVAEALGRDFDFVRVDLYDTTIGVRLGEITVYPDGGERGKPSGCPELDGWLGTQWPMSLAATAATVGLNCVEWASDSVMARLRGAYRRLARARSKAS